MAELSTGGGHDKADGNGVVLIGGCSAVAARQARSVLLFDALLQNSPTRLFLDSGSVCNIMSFALANRLSIKVEELTESLGFALADGTVVKALGECRDVSVAIGSFVGKARFFVFPSVVVADALLGLEFLRQFDEDMSINWRTGVVKGSSWEWRAGPPGLYPPQHQPAKTTKPAAEKNSPAQQQVFASDKNKKTVVASAQPAFAYTVEPGMPVCAAMFPVAAIDGQSTPSLRAVEAPAQEAELITFKQLRKMVRRGEQVFAVVPKIRSFSAPAASVFANVTDVLAERARAPDAVAAEQAVLREFADVFQEPTGLPPHRPVEHAIPTLEGARPVSRRPYALSVEQEAELQRQLAVWIERGWVRESFSPYASPVLLVPKKDGAWRVCIDFRGLNQQTHDDAFPFPDTARIFAALAGATVFSKLDLRQGYMQMRVVEEDIHKTAFITRDGLYEFCVMPFGLKSAPKSFVRLMAHVLKPVLFKSCVCFLDDILVYSTDVKQHDAHVREVLRLLQEHTLFAAPEKCQFFRTSVTFLGFRVSGGKVAVADDKAAEIRRWPQPTTVGELRSFLGFAGFLRQFVRDFGPLAKTLYAETGSQRLADGTAVPTPNGRKLVWTKQLDTAFRQLKDAICTAPALRLPRADSKLVLESDASRLGSGAILYEEWEGARQPVGFMSRVWPTSMQHYDVRDLELEAIRQAVTHWAGLLRHRHFTIITDHQSLSFLNSSKQISHKLMRRRDLLSDFDFDIVYRPGRLMKADWLSRVGQGPTAQVLDSREDVAITTLAAVLDHTEPLALCAPELRARLLAAYAADDEVSAIITKLRETAASGSVHRTYGLTSDGLLYRHSQGQPARAVVPADNVLRTDILRDAHDSALSAHPGPAKTMHLVSQRFFWPKLEDDVRAFCKSCDACQRSKHPRQAKAGLVSPMPIPEQRWDAISMDLLGPLPKTESGNTVILVVVERMTRRCVLIPAPSMEAEAVARALFDRIICEFGFFQHLTCDRDARFTSQLFQSFRKWAGFKMNISSARHAETDGLSEVYVKSTTEKLRALVTQDERSWDQLLPCVQFALNNTVQSGTQLTPFYADTLRHPRLPIDTTATPDLPLPQRVRQFTEVLRLLSFNLALAQERFTVQSNKRRRDIEFEVGDEVMLHAKGIEDASQADQPANKLKSVWLGPFRVISKLSNVVYRLQLPSHMRISSAFHISKLKKYNATPARFASRAVHEPGPPLLDDPSLFEVDRVIKSRVVGPRARRREQLLVRWKGYGPAHDSWVEAADYDDASATLAKARDEPAAEADESVIKPSKVKPPPTTPVLRPALIKKKKSVRFARVLTKTLYFDCDHARIRSDSVASRTRSSRV